MNQYCKETGKVPIIVLLTIALIVAAVLLYNFFGNGGSDSSNWPESTPVENSPVQQADDPQEKIPDVPESKRIKTFDQLAAAGFPASEMPKTLLIRFSEQSFIVQIELDGFKAETLKAFDQSGFWESFTHSFEKIKTGEFFKREETPDPSDPASVSFPVIQSVLVINARTPGIKDSAGKIIGKYFSDINVNYYDTKE